LILAVRRRWRQGGFEGKALILLVALSLAVRLLGAGYEVEERAYRDEGTYYHHAQEINQGKVLRFSFVYPHLTYHLDAFTLWLVDLHPRAWAAAADAVYGVTEPLARQWLALRLLAALLHGLAVIPVFAIARRFGGAAAGILGALLLIFSLLFNDASHLIISDGPSAVFAIACLALVARLLDQESRRDYLLAGVFAGLAAAAKYPAGLVAVAILAVWVRGRWRERRFSWDLLWAGLVSLATFVAAMPTLLLYPRQALFGGHGMLFGVRQYSQGGWIGVMPESTTLYYAAELAASFGLPALLLGALGLLALPREGRRKVAWMLPFPLLYLLLIAAMNMVVRRNLQPVIPVLAALLGLGLAALASRASRLDLNVLGSGLRYRATEGRNWPARGWLAVGIVLLGLLPPLWATTVQAVGFARPGTRQLATEWVNDHVPEGASILKETYTPKLDPARYELRQSRFVARLSSQEIRGHDFVILAKPAYARFLRPEERREEHHDLYARRYREILDTFPKRAEFRATRLRLGPWLEIYEVPASPGETPPVRVFPPAEIHVPDGNMRRKRDLLRFTLPGQWVQVSAVLPARGLRLELAGSGEGTLKVLSSDGAVLTEEPLSPSRPARWQVPEPGRYFLRVALPQGSEVRGLWLIRQTEGSQDAEDAAPADSAKESGDEAPSSTVSQFEKSGASAAPAGAQSPGGNKRGSV
jgi:hypothetical protein